MWSLISFFVDNDVFVGWEWLFVRDVLVFLRGLLCVSAFCDYVLGWSWLASSYCWCLFFSQEEHVGSAYGLFWDDLVQISLSVWDTWIIPFTYVAPFIPFNSVFISNHHFAYIFKSFADIFLKSKLLCPSLYSRYMVDVDGLLFPWQIGPLFPLPVIPQCPSIHKKKKTTAY